MKRPWLRVLAFSLLNLLGCQASPAPAPTSAHLSKPLSAPVDDDVAVNTQALCLTGPAFPSCYGNCGFLSCSAIDPGACCSCDDGCVARGDCCCDYPTYCAPASDRCNPSPDASCTGHCGSQAPTGCWCDSLCTGYGDCCADYAAQCQAADPNLSCVGHCGTRAPGGCWCDSLCTGYGDCCTDYNATCACSGSVTQQNADERVEAIAISAAGEVYVAGTRAPPSGFASDQSDGFLRRVDPVTFATLWDRPIDNCYWDTVNDVTVMPGGDVVVVGATRNGPIASTPTRLLVRRYSSGGNLMWEATPTTSLGAVVGHAVAADRDHGTIVVTGAVTSASTIAPLFARLDGLGGVRSLTALPGPGSSVGRSIAVECGGDIAIVTRDSGEARVMALNAAGAVRWTATDVAGSEGVGVAFTGSGDVYAVSTVRGSSGTLGSLSRFSDAGSLVFRRTLDLSSRHYNPIGGVAVGASDTAVVAGSVATPVGVLEPFVQEVSASGSVLATHIHSGTTVSGVTGVAVGGTRALLAAEVRPSGTLTQTLIVSDTL